jgi:peptidoglycan/xylan/chitin deacetylase (PgdA/CDA1 family)
VSTTPPACLTVHAERLHDDATWRHVRWLLDVLERRDGRGSFFVCPLRASTSGVDIAPRIREIAARGHEVGQHTHFYALQAGEGGPPRFEKRTDLSPDNVRRCLDHDLAVLRRAGIQPRGFVAGAWAIDDTVLAWLGENGFAYDLSFRSFPLRYESVPAARGEGCWAPFRQGALLEIPTTASLALALRQALLGRERWPMLGADRFQVLYLHDYDLLDWRQRALLRLLDAWLGRVPRVTAGTLEARSAAWLAAA